MKKGQGAMEFLMTYGWAILVVLIAIGCLWYFGVLNPDSFKLCSCSDLDLTTGYILKDGDIEYHECLNATKYIDYEKKKMIFNVTSELYYCDENKDLALIE